MRRILLITTVCFLWVILSDVALGGVVSIPSGNGSGTSYFESHVGLTRNRSIGQSFKVPAPAGEKFLNRLSFETGVSSLFAPILDYAVYVYEFNSSTRKTVGAALFDSGPMQLTTESELLEVLTLNFFPGVELDVSKNYIAFLTTQGEANDSDSRASVDSVAGAGYTDGQLVVQFGTSLAPTFATDAWQVDFTVDLAGFVAEFARARW